MAANIGDTTVHNDCGSITRSLKNRLNAAKDARFDGAVAKSFQIEMHVKWEKFLYIFLHRGKTIFENVFCTAVYTIII